MSQYLKEKGGLIFGVVQAVILGVCVVYQQDIAKMTIEHGKILAAHSQLLQTHSEELKRIEDRGSPGLQAHEDKDEQRIGEINKTLGETKARLTKIEDAILVTPGELKAISTRLDGLTKSTDRIEMALKDHLNDRKP